MLKFLSRYPTSKFKSLNICEKFSMSTIRMESNYQILGLSPGVTFPEIKQAYLNLSKKYHPDVSKEKDASEMFKKINLAYSALKKDFAMEKDEDPQPQASAQTASSPKSSGFKSWSGPMTEEEELYFKIFQKTFKDDPAAFYSVSNAHLRKQFEEAIEKLKKTKESQESMKKDDYDKERDEEFKAYAREMHQNNNSYQHQSSGSTYAASSDSGNQAGMFVTFGILGSAIAMIMYNLKDQTVKINNKFEGSPKPASDIAIEEFRQKHLTREKEKIEKKKQDFMESLAPMLKYPQKNPIAINMLTNYTIWTDLKMYHVDPNCFYFDEKQFKTTDNFEKHPIYNVKLNNMLTLALEAERLLKNTYVKVDDVIKSLQETGTFQPPGIFFRYFGYIYFRIRRKPIIAENLQEHMKNGEKNISLFDLYFRYSSPILIANPDYYEIPVDDGGWSKESPNKNGIKWTGNIHVNYRPVKPVVVNPEDKNIFFWRGSKGRKNEPEQDYILTWGNYYQVYEKIHQESF